ncbi:ABC phosphonate transporter inner membrane protein [Psychromonas ingrahamii 37]|uniref:ABC phosphonate transporter inner membrane protein n=1 Tax=Psychromonas ingrahamii (strain DSM 17664 / CCUG 51855 / 37) TaxID=357804 RepID=A1T0V5_PSYIN|nr:phosphonate ABC transporter, permease protein PhnE [Psychromonas ingrahamii]ABM05370.1 ABC phosphonate transporter inner membrane protein [Psychromonas ingrahamii 37]
MNKNTQNHIKRDHSQWQTYQAITPKTVLFLFLAFVLLAWSGQNTEMDKAAIETSKAVLSAVGIGDSEVLNGVSKFASQAFPIQLQTRTELSRIEGLDLQHLPWLSYIKEGVSREYYIDTDTWTEEKAQYLIEPLGYLKKVLWMMWETIEMGFWGTIISIVISLPLGILAARNYSPHPIVYHVARAWLSFHRSMPELIVALFLVLIYGFGPIAGVLALAIHTSGVLGKFFADEIENAAKGPQMALSSAGANAIKVLRYAVFPQVLPAWIASVQYIFERNIRTATVLGIVGAGGIGMELKGRWDIFDYDYVATILLIVFITVVVLEFFSQKLRKKTL